VLGDLGPPDGNRPFHDPDAGGYNEIIDPVARPFLTLVAGVESLRLNAVPDRAGFAEAVHLFRRISLHAPVTLRILGFCPVKVPQDGLEFLIAVPRREINAAGAAVQTAGGHQISIFDFLFAPSFHINILLKTIRNGIETPKPSKNGSAACVSYFSGHAKLLTLTNLKKVQMNCCASSGLFTKLLNIFEINKLV
jgi:hypothetical protein